MHPIFNLTANIDRPYYFGVGGIGDFLLLMSTFYDDMDEKGADVVFIANNVNPLIKLTKPSKVDSPTDHEIFPKVNRFWFFPRSAFPLSPELWDKLQTDTRLHGTGVTPKNFNYIGDWNECGRSSVFEYYDVVRNPAWAMPWMIRPKHPVGVIQPFGGANDPTKVKRMSDALLKQLVNHECYQNQITFIGSPSDLEYLKSIPWDNRDTDSYPINYVSDMKQSIASIKAAAFFIGTDSWGKTMAGLCGTPMVQVYRNKYIRATPQQMFKQDTDPSDFVFLHNWGFTMEDDPYAD